MVLLQHRESHMRMMLKDKYPVCLLHDGDLIVFTSANGSAGVQRAGKSHETGVSKE